jgi:hypothetical protein
MMKQLNPEDNWTILVLQWHNARTELDKAYTKLDNDICSDPSALSRRLDSAMLVQISRLMGTTKEALIECEWAWAEWSPSKDCYFYVRGWLDAMEAQDAV